MRVRTAPKVFVSKNIEILFPALSENINAIYTKPVRTTTSIELHDELQNVIMAKQRLGHIQNQVILLSEIHQLIP